jgi:hypothetical protein
MVGPVLVTVALVLGVPIAVMLGGAIWSAAIGWTFTPDDEQAT